VAKTSKNRTVPSSGKSKGKSRPVAVAKPKLKKAAAKPASKPTPARSKAKPLVKSKPATKPVAKATTKSAKVAKSAKPMLVVRKAVTAVTATKPTTGAIVKTVTASKVAVATTKGTAIIAKATKAVIAKASAVAKPIIAPLVEAKPEKVKKKLPPEPAYRPPLQESVPTNGKPRKNQAGLLTKELEHFRDLLIEKRREIVGDMSSMEREALRSGGGGLSSLPVHMADMGTDNYEQEFTLGLVEKDRNLLREINAALAKIQNGTYGLCEGTGNPISKARLEAQPWARFSIEHARQMERQRGIR
jgi:RNA polymerase-binding protein DksA